MRKIIMCLIAGAVLTSCYEDKGNYDYTAMPAVVIEGIERGYSRYAMEDELKIAPRVENESKYDFCWQIYDSVLVYSTPIIPDTLTLTKDLNIEFDFNYKPGRYILVFNARDKATGYTEIVQSSLTITTINMTGWYLTKQVGNEADMDFYYSGGSVPNWISAQNGGYRLQGNAIKTVFMRNFKETPTGDQINCLMTLTDRDASIFRVQDGGLSRDFENMFFTVPAERNIKTCIVQTGFVSFYLIMNNESYNMTSGAYGGCLFIDPPRGGGVKLADFGVTGMEMVSFDQTSHSFVALQGSSYRTFNELSTAPLSCNNMDADLIWGEGYQASRWNTVTIMEKRSTPGQYMWVSLTTGTNMWSWGNPITKIVNIPGTSKILQADIRGGHFDLELTYFADGANVYKHDINTGEEAVVFSVPSDETITLIQHVKFPIIPSNPDYTNLLAVATVKNGQYKVWMLDLKSTGEVQDTSAAPKYQGEGIIKSIIYIEGDASSCVYF